MENPYLKISLKQNIRACQLKQIRMLKCVRDICQKYHLTYWLDGGTLLGAVRHGGFIPWDDDIDIGMDAASYKKFMEVASAELPQDLLLQTPDINPMTYYTMKVRDMNSLCLTEGLDCTDAVSLGFALDIFEFVPYPSVCKTFVKFITRKICISKIYFASMHLISWGELFKYTLFKFRYWVFWMIWFFFSLFSGKKYLGNAPANNVYGKLHKTTDIFPLGEIGFEGDVFACPGNSENYLSDLYKNYMTLPPENKRKVHAIFIHPFLAPEKV